MPRSATLSIPKRSGEVSVGVPPALGCSRPLFDGFLHRPSPPASLQHLQRPARRTSQLATTLPHRCGGRQSGPPRAALPSLGLHLAGCGLQSPARDHCHSFGEPGEADRVLHPASHSTCAGLQAGREVIPPQPGHSGCHASVTKLCVQPGHTAFMHV